MDPLIWAELCPPPLGLLESLRSAGSLAAPLGRGWDTSAWLHVVCDPSCRSVWTYPHGRGKVPTQWEHEGLLSSGVTASLSCWPHYTGKSKLRFQRKGNRQGLLVWGATNSPWMQEGKSWSHICIHVPKGIWVFSAHMVNTLFLGGRVG